MILKRSLITAVLGWGLITILAVGFAPLNLSEHTQYDYQLNYDNTNDNYHIVCLGFKPLQKLLY